MDRKDNMLQRKDYATTLIDAEIIRKQVFVKEVLGTTIKELLTIAINSEYPKAVEIKKVKDNLDDKSQKA